MLMPSCYTLPRRPIFVLAYAIFGELDRGSVSGCHRLYGHPSTQQYIVHRFPSKSFPSEYFFLTNCCTLDFVQVALFRLFDFT